MDWLRIDRADFMRAGPLALCSVDENEQVRLDPKGDYEITSMKTTEEGFFVRIKRRTPTWTWG